MRINIILLPCYGEIIDEVLAFFYENTNCKQIKKIKILSLTLFKQLVSGIQEPLYESVNCSVSRR